MWVIIAKKGLDKHRDDLISEILDVEKEDTQEFFLKKSTYGKYASTPLMQESVMYKQEVSCKRLISRFEKSKGLNTINRWDKFYYMKEYHLSYRKIEKQEWFDMCNSEINKLTMSYNYHKDILEKKKLQYK